MKILVANLGSTSFKFRLFDMAEDRELARGGTLLIGSLQSTCFVEIAGRRRDSIRHVADHAEAVRQCLADLTDPASGCLKDAAEVSARCGVVQRRANDTQQPRFIVPRVGHIIKQAGLSAGDR